MFPYIPGTFMSYQCTLGRVGGRTASPGARTQEKEFQYRTASLPFYCAGNRNSCRARGVERS